MTRTALAIAALAAVAAVAFWVTSRTGTANVTQPDDVDIVAGADLFAENCAACHGAELEGRPDWRSLGADGRFPAPPHDETGHTWHHGDLVLFDYTKLGGRAALAKSGVEDFDSGMPRFADSLSDRQIWDIIAYIKSTWPDRIRVVQAERSAIE
jgi:mono/diheme cytochrome c family protein